MLQRDIHAFWKKYIVEYVFCSLLAMHYCMLVHIPIEIVREDHKISELFIIWTNIYLDWVMSHIKYVKNAIGLIIQDTTFLRRLALKEAYILTIFIYFRNRNKFHSKFIFMIVLTTLTAKATMQTKQFNLAPFCRSSFCAHIHTVQKIYYVPITFTLYLRNRLRNNVQNQDINEK